MAKKKAIKKKKVSITTLKKKLWKACSEFIRTRDKGICFTCNFRAFGSGYHAGHFITSKLCNLELRYDPRNIRGQCYNCNINLNGNTVVFYRKMLEEFGQKYVDDLCDQIGVKVEWTKEDYEAKTLFYQKALEMLKSR